VYWQNWRKEQNYNEAAFKDGKVIYSENERFDLLCTEVLEHVFNIDELLKEFNRVLKENGKALIMTPLCGGRNASMILRGILITPFKKYLYQKKLMLWLKTF
jgi:2-polyprenyl-3-methyl-5-hydroxy-6-metoxy-1,4-benzoquinol methylase